MRDEQQIKEMARDICRVQPSCNDVCNPAECCTAWKYANRAYDAGYRKPEWISVEDRLPEDMQEVLCYKGKFWGNLQDVYAYLGDGKWQDDYGNIADAEDEGITHWMPLPAPPTEKEN